VLRFFGGPQGDQRGAALAGIAAGVVIGLMLMIGGLLGRRKSS